MGEAWFMGDKREMFDYLLREKISELDVLLLARPLEEIASGNSCFGPMREWNEWLLYLLGVLIDDCLKPKKRRLQELLVTALMASHSDGLQSGPYHQFRDDVLRTLGLVIMDGSKWSHGRVIHERVLIERPYRSDRPWGWWQASGDLSSSLFLLLKYLEPGQVQHWAVSAFAIADPHWRAQLLVWLEGARPLLETPGAQPKEIFMVEPQVDWASSHVLAGNYSADQSDTVPLVPLLPVENKRVFKSTLRQVLTESTLHDWQESIASVEQLIFEAGHITSSSGVLQWLADET